MKKLLVLMAAIVLVVVSGCEKKIDPISMEQAKTFALQEVNGEIVAEEMDLDDDDPTYTFTIIKDQQKFEVELNAETGGLISKERDEDYIPPVAPSNPSNPNNPSEHEITREEAQAIVLGQVQGEVRNIHLDHEDHHQFCNWEIEIVAGEIKYDFDVNANTGEITKQEKESIFD